MKTAHFCDIVLNSGTWHTGRLTYCILFSHWYDEHGILDTQYRDTSKDGLEAHFFSFFSVFGQKNGQTHKLSKP